MIQKSKLKNEWKFFFKESRNSIRKLLSILGLIVFLTSFTLPNFEISFDEIKFKNMLWDKEHFKKFISDDTFGYFMFQLSNRSAVHSNRQYYELIVYAFHKDHTLYPSDELTPTSLIGRFNGASLGFKRFSKDVQLGNLLMTADKFKSLIPADDAYKYLRFEPDDNTSGRYKEYVSYKVFPVTDDGRTRAKKNAGLVEDRLNPSPPATFTDDSDD